MFNKTINELLKEEHWYNQGLFNLYYREGMTYRGIKNETGISTGAIWKTVTETVRNIKNKMN